MILPWHKNQWQWFLRAKKSDRLPHAVLLVGPSGIGKAKFADGLTRALLCRQATAAAIYCGANEETIAPQLLCHPCRLIQGGTHPNILWTVPEKSGQAIKVDQVREMALFTNQSALQNGHRIIVIDPADEMNAAAANALLKTLEEPPADTLLILITHRAARLPRTVLSRCQRVVFTKPHRDQAMPWLEKHLADAAVSKEVLLSLVNGAPLAASQFINNDMLALREKIFQGLYQLPYQQDGLLSVASKIQDSDVLPVLDFILCWLIDLLRLQCGGNEIVNKDYTKELSALKQITQLTNNLKLMEQVQAIRAQISRGFNLNKQLMLENILVNWCMKR